ncbi:MAG: exodeoxyribonuclease VII small subunit [bacterium]|nr:exodeoxyribonuclease VII small subunit [bacterium]
MKDMDFEKQIAELESIVRELESGSISLDESLALFEKGIKLTKSCQKMLDEAEKKVSMLISDGSGDMVEKDFINEE